jgi:P-type Ca2+ transporter type 2C
MEETKMGIPTIKREQTGEAPAYRQTVGEVLATQGTDARCGLGETEAQARLGRFGKNELTAAEPVTAWRKFLALFQDALVVLLLVATAISARLWLYERELLIAGIRNLEPSLC